jgi:hypothetical protein
MGGGRQQPKCPVIVCLDSNPIEVAAAKNAPGNTTAGFGLRAQLRYLHPSGHG